MGGGSGVNLSGVVDQPESDERPRSHAKGAKEAPPPPATAPPRWPNGRPTNLPAAVTVVPLNIEFAGPRPVR